MKDACGRDINYLRLSITDRCNLRCHYCLPPGGVALKSHADILRYEELLTLVRVAVELGIVNFRVTGGEPLVRRGVVNFIADVAAIPGVEDLALTTNGQLLAGMAAPLKAAGLRRVNVSLDTLRPWRYRSLTRGGQLQAVLAGLEAALAAGLHPVKVNCVVMRGVNDDEIAEFADLSRDRPLHVRFIELMPLGHASGAGPDSLVTSAEIRERLAAAVPVDKAEVTGHGPARYYRLPGAEGTVGFISPMTEHFCPGCNRLRLSADGRLYPCLAFTSEVDVRGPLRAGATEAELAGLFRQALAGKPSGHELGEAYTEAKLRQMSSIGG